MVPGIIDHLYADEINVRVESFYDRGFEVALGDRMNGFVARTEGLRSFAEVLGWLHAAVLQHFPESTYARTAHRGQPS